MRSFSQLWPTLKRLLAYGSPWRKPLGIAVLMMWVAAAAEVSGPLLISYFIDNMVAKNNLPLKVVAGLAAAYVGLQLFAAGLHYEQSLLFNRAAVGVVQQLRTDVMDAALRQPLSEFDTQPVGQVISRVTNDTEVIRDLYVTVVATVLRSAALVGAMLVSLALLLALLVWYVFWLRARIPDVGVSFFGAAYTGLLLCGLVIIRVSLPAPWGGVCVLLLFLSVWANDAFAYLVGSKIGRHKLAPRTSPKKSWEGFIAGLVGSVIFWCLMTLVPGITMAIPQAIVFGIISGCMGVLGDLAESRIKRNSGFKDSGTIMPGHGGLLDRSDSLFLTSITAAILLIAGGCIPYALF